MILKQDKLKEFFAPFNSDYLKIINLPPKMKIIIYTQSLLCNFYVKDFKYDVTKRRSIDWGGTKAQGAKEGI